MLHSDIHYPEGSRGTAPVTLIERRLELGGTKIAERTTVANSANIFEHRSASSVPTYNFLFPIIPGMTTSPGRLPKLIFVLPSLSSKTRQLLARGNKAPSGKSSDKVELNWERMVENESF